jgi:hypothetical protein
VTQREEYVLQSMQVICEEAEKLFELHPGLREFEVVRLNGDKAQVKMSKRRPDCGRRCLPGASACTGPSGHPQSYPPTLIKCRHRKH